MDSLEILEVSIHKEKEKKIQANVLKIFVHDTLNLKILKLSLNFSLTHLRAQIACYEFKGDLSPVMLKEIFHDGLKISKFTRICIDDHASVTGRQ